MSHKKSSTIYIFISTGPPVIVQPDNEEIKKTIGESLKMNCEVTGYPKVSRFFNKLFIKNLYNIINNFFTQPHVYWTKLDETVHDGEFIWKKSVELNDAGVYICIAQNALGVTQKEIHLAIVELPHIDIGPENITILPTETKDQYCLADGAPPPNVYWVYGREKVHEGDVFTMNATMKPGQYSCIAENSEGRIESSFYFEVLTKPKLIIGFDKISLKRVLIEGDSLELACSFENYDIIIWEKNEILLKTEFESQLVKNQVDASTIGDYKCTAVNSIGNSSLSYQVDVLTAPKIVVKDDKTLKTEYKALAIEEIILVTGETLKLSCEAQGNPAPTIKWTKSKATIGEGKTLEISHVSMKDRGIYSCDAENSQGISQKIFKIEIHSAPFITDGIREVAEEKPLGDFVELDCNIDGFPTPTVLWFKNG